MNRSRTNPTANRSMGTTPTRDVASTLQAILGVHDLNNAKAINTALSQVFVPEEVSGVTRYVYTPRTYSVQIDANVTLTGSRASQFSFAKDLISRAKKLLEVIYPFVEIDDASANALKATIAETMNQLLEEFRRAEGPIKGRTEILFFHLLGKGENLNPDDIEGNIGCLRDNFGLIQGGGSDTCQIPQVNNEQQAKNLTDFYIMADYIISLHKSWLDNLNNSRVNFGTLISNLGQQLAVAFEAVIHLRSTLDEVGISENFQRAIQLESVDTSLYNLLSWIDDFVSTRGPKLLSEGGKFAIERDFHTTVDKLTCYLRQVIEEDLKLDKADSTALPDGCPEYFMPFFSEEAKENVRFSFTNLYQILCILERESNSKNVKGRDDCNEATESVVERSQGEGDLESIDGIGSARAQALREAGIQTLKQFICAENNRLKTIFKMSDNETSTKQIEGMKQDAKSKLGSEDRES